MHPQVRLLSVAFDTPILVEILRANRDEFMTLWLADQFYAVVKDEKLANESMKVARKKINPIKTINNLWQ
ncbi:MAG: hypothetical protein NW218_02600 [Saprospiraceae bacterium]|nr:hypothetical protein [Saprospiraceae bacterium]